MRHTGIELSENNAPLETDDSWDFSNVVDSSESTKLPNGRAEGQSSLLEVFEAELAKNAKGSSSQINGSPAPATGPRSNAFSARLEQLTFHKERGPAKSMPTRSLHQPSCAATKDLLDVDAAMNISSPMLETRSKPMDSTASYLSTPQLASSAIEDGIKTAVSGFETCLRGIANTLKAAQAPSHKSEKQIFEETILAFRELAGDFKAQQPAASREDRNIHNIPQHVKKIEALFPAQNSTTVNMKATKAPETPLQAPPTRIPVASRANEQQSGQQLDEKKDRKADTLLPAKQKQLRFDDEKLTETPNFLSDISTGSFQYHRPGPIHLPAQTPWLRTELKNSGYIDHLRRFSSVDTLRKPARHDRSASPAVTTRFPTVAQFENTNFSSKTTAQPAVAPLIDLESESGAGNQQVLQDVARESSGQFFNRMTGVNDSDGSASKFRLVRPFDAFEDIAQRNEGVRRSNTVATSTYKPQPTLRRPYSEIFSGNGRVPWESFTVHRKHEPSARPDAQASKNDLPMPPHPVIQSKPLRQGHLTASLSESRVADESCNRRSPDHAPSNLRPQDMAVRKCVDRLLELGFDMERSRLRVYASASSGNLNDALDMISEEQQAYDDRQ